MNDMELGKECEREDFAYVRLLKVCAKTKDLHGGARLHAEILKRNLLEKSPYISSSLINMYAKCGDLKKAQQVLDAIPVRNVVSWSAVIAGYAQQGQGQKALDCFERMQREGLCADAVTFTCILKACGSMRTSAKGKQVHDEIVTRGLLEKDVVLSNALVDMYVKCGQLMHAQEVHDQLLVRDIVSWNALIAGYGQQGHNYEAWACFQQMQRENHFPDKITLSCILKACGSIDLIHKGKQIHSDIINKGLLQQNIILGNSLIDMYAKCDVYPRAWQVHEELIFRDAVSWNVLIAWHVHSGNDLEALNCFEQMQHEGCTADVVTLTCVLKACGSIGAAQNGEKVHNEIVRRCLLENDIMLGVTLVDMYAKCGLLDKAQQVHDELPFRDANSWKVLIRGYGENEQNSEILNCYGRLRSEDIFPDVATLVSILKACSNMQALDKGKQIHDEVSNRGLLANNTMLGNAIVDMYAKCNDLAKALEVFSEIPDRDIFSWNMLIGGYSRQGQSKEALDCFYLMKNEGIPPDAVTFTCILKSCGNMGAIEMGKLIHDEILNRGLLLEDFVLGTALVDMYAKCGMMTKAQQVLEEIPIRNEVSWFALISGYSQQQQNYELLLCLKQMRSEGFFPDDGTLVSVLKACADDMAIEVGKRIHAEVINRRFLNKNTVLGSAVVDMYAKCGMLEEAHKAHDYLPLRDIVIWNTIIGGYSQQGRGHDALNCFEQMKIEGLFPDVVTLVCILKACCSAGALAKGKEIHEEVVMKDIFGKNVALGNALVDMYAKFGMLEKASQVHDDLPARDTVTWNALIGGYAQQGECHKALNFFEWMQNEGLIPNEVTFICILKACGSMGAVDEGKRIHNNIIRSELLEQTDVLHNALVDMYSKCGLLKHAQRVHDQMPVHSLVSWNTLIAGYAEQGQGHEALICFEQIKYEGLNPNAITLLCVLTACSHSGLLHEAQTYYENISKHYGIIPNLEHQTCMVGTFGHAGRFDKAIMTIKSMSFSNYLPAWQVFLTACKKWGHVKLGRLAFNQVIQLCRPDIWHTRTCGKG